MHFDTLASQSGYTINFEFDKKVIELEKNGWHS